MLIDEDRSVIKKFDVYQSIGIDGANIAKHSLFLISNDGFITYRYVGKSQFDFPSAAKIKEVIKQS